ncbi:hypothetical protein PVAP13_9KG343500 [Panicum virgatum]|uniref:Uncharacterized protein n=1 Tax=Panicum virgatum TaxID=38727 RepID=A0A8T0NQW8_PANVG|nr:hypothetical protein PVAP13_9KG343500 [Panicum virgatum]
MRTPRCTVFLLGVALLVVSTMNAVHVDAGRALCAGELRSPEPGTAIYRSGYKFSIHHLKDSRQADGMAWT